MELKSSDNGNGNGSGKGNKGKIIVQIKTVLASVFTFAVRHLTI